MFQDVTRDRAKTVTRAGQIGAVALASLAGVVLAVGLPGTGAPKIERPEPLAPMHAADPAPTIELPAILEKRATSIALNLAQLGNAPKLPVAVVGPGDDTTADPVAPVAPAPAPEAAIIFLGLLGSPARPMALISIDSHQQVLAIGDIIHRGSGEKIKLLKAEKNAIEIELKGATKKIEVAPRTGATYTTLQSPSGAAGANPGFVPPPQPANPGSNPNRPRRDFEMRAPGGRRGNPQRFDESGGARE
ncbi:MAG: hypothetical protein KF805_15650 [Phycisphaeraceae bacterium]|nr:hypothetical protein [Phycisphaeraceae bacterium]